MLVALAVAVNSCAIRPRLKVEGATGTNIKGDYSLILYGCTHYNDLRTLAILDKEGDRYTIEPYAPAFDWRVIKHLSGKEALKKAECFVSSCNPDFLHSQLNTITTAQDAIAGYEVMPLYWSFAYPGSRVLDTYYFSDKDKIMAVIKLKHRFEMKGEGDFGRRDR